MQSLDSLHSQFAYLQHERMAEAAAERLAAQARSESPRSSADKPLFAPSRSRPNFLSQTCPGARTPDFTATNVFGRAPRVDRFFLPLLSSWTTLAAALHLLTVQFHSARISLKSCEPGRAFEPHP